MERVRRRDWLRAVAGGAALLAGCRSRACLRGWNGLAFGSEVSILFEPPPAGGAAELSARCSAEVRRLEAIFSLEQETSAVRRLNESGVLENPPRKLAEALGICRELYQRTGGAFDVSVQPLWELYEAHYRRHPEDADGPPDEALRQTREKVGFDAVEWDARSARLLRPGMALTLNGMAQGFATDRIAELLLRAGVKRALINLGEYRAIGTAPEEVAWNIAIRGAGGQILAELPLADRALATSAGSGWTFDSQGRFHHLFHPRGGSARPARETLVVAAPAAAWADGLATAGLVMKPADFARVIAELDWPAEFRRYEGG